MLHEAPEDGPLGAGGGTPLAGFQTGQGASGPLSNVMVCCAWVGMPETQLMPKCVTLCIICRLASRWSMRRGRRDEAADVGCPCQCPSTPKLREWAHN